MKKRQITGLIQAHCEGNEEQFIAIANQISQEFYSLGDIEVASFITACLSNSRQLSLQSVSTDSPSLNWLEPIEDQPNLSIVLPHYLKQEIEKICRAIRKNVGVNRFILHGAAGTGKTESTKIVAKKLEKPLYFVNLSTIIDSKLGQTSKNIVSLFQEIEQFKKDNKPIIVFDELDALCLDRESPLDIREMSRVSTTFFKELDRLSQDSIIFATTNLINKMDKALLRRFDYSVSFDNYSLDDLREIYYRYILFYIEQFKLDPVPLTFWEKILSEVPTLPSPALIHNSVKTTFAFSNPDEPYSHVVGILKSLYPEGSCQSLDQFLYEAGLPLRIIQDITGTSKSALSRRFAKQPPI